MSIWGSWPAVGEDEETGELNGEALTYQHSGIYPSPSDLPATVGISHIPGFVRRDPDLDDFPSAPYVRLDIASWSDEFGRPMIADGATVILTRVGVEKLRDDLSKWLELGQHDT